MISLHQILFFIVLFQQIDNTNSGILFHGSRNDKLIALTFDACPSSLHGGYDSSIVKILVDSGVPATFFLSGKWIAKHKRATKELSSIPNFELGNHSYSHSHITTISDSAVRSEILRTESLLISIGGKSARLFRPPYGIIDTQIVHIAQGLGLATVLYDLVTGDPDSTISQNRLVNYIVSHARSGSIIIMHVNGHGWHTAQVLPEIIYRLRKMGFKFVKVSTFLEATKGSIYSKIK
jgi:peptidoglycan/xylan/chitin deacetylase (PgdA/CDA1 family)